MYPGRNGSVNDEVYFNLAAFGGVATGPATLDVALDNPLDTLELAGWNDTLTLNFDLPLVGSTSGSHFQLTDISTIVLAANRTLLLQDLPGLNVWNSGDIWGAGGSTFHIAGSQLNIEESPGTLEPNMIIGPSASALGSVYLTSMTNNLVLNGAANFIEVEENGSLNLYQQIAVNGQQNNRGGIVIGMANGSDVAVQVDSGGWLNRGGTPAVGVTNQVVISGAVYNEGGFVYVAEGAWLNLTGTDANGYSYWQDTSEDAELYVDATSNITATGTYNIDAGYVKLGALSNAVPAFDVLDGSGLIFGTNFSTYLEIFNSTVGVPGEVYVGGSVILAATTTLRMNFSGANNTADLLTVQNGSLTLAGSLELHSVDTQLPTAALNLFAVSAAAPSISVNFTTITDDAGGAVYTWGTNAIPGLVTVELLIT